METSSQFRVYMGERTKAESVSHITEKTKVK